VGYSTRGRCATCPMGQHAVEIAARTGDAVLKDAEIRLWSGSRPSKPLLAKTNSYGLAHVCLPERRVKLGIYYSGAKPVKASIAAGQEKLVVEVTLRPGESCPISP
jgi:hypothetical protein